VLQPDPSEKTDGHIQLHHLARSTVEHPFGPVKSRTGP